MLHNGKGLHGLVEFGLIFCNRTLPMLVADTDESFWLGLNTWTQEACLSQAWGVFHARSVSLRDELSDFSTWRSSLPFSFDNTYKNSYPTTAIRVATFRIQKGEHDLNTRSTSLFVLLLLTCQTDPLLRSFSGLLTKTATLLFQTVPTTVSVYQLSSNIATLTPGTPGPPRTAHTSTRIESFEGLILRLLNLLNILDTTSPLMKLSLARIHLKRSTKVRFRFPVNSSMFSIFLRIRSRSFPIEFQWRPISKH